MAQAIMDPEEVRRFATELKRFNQDVQVRARLHGGLRLGHPLGAQVVLLVARGDDVGAVEEQQRDITCA